MPQPGRRRDDAGRPRPSCCSTARPACPMHRPPARRRSRRAGCAPRRGNDRAGSCRPSRWSRIPSARTTSAAGPCHVLPGLAAGDFVCVEGAAAAGSPWGGVDRAPRTSTRSRGWRRTDPGRIRGCGGWARSRAPADLNGGQQNLSFAPIRPGDVITSVAARRRLREGRPPRHDALPHHESAGPTSAATSSASASAPPSTTDRHNGGNRAGRRDRTRATSAAPSPPTWSPTGTPSPSSTPTRLGAPRRRGGQRPRLRARRSPERAAEITFTSLPTPSVVRRRRRRVAGAAAARDSILVDLSTNAPGVRARARRRLAAAGRHLVEAPLTGGAPGRPGAHAGVHGRRRAGVVERCRPLLERLGRATFHVGGLGLGNTAKLVNSLMRSPPPGCRSRALAVAAKAGIDVRTMIEDPPHRRRRATSSPTAWSRASTNAAGRPSSPSRWRPRTPA